MVSAYSEMGRVIALNAETISSFFFPPFGKSKCFQNVKHLFCFSNNAIALMLISGENVSFGSRVIQEFLG